MPTISLADRLRGCYSGAVYDVLRAKGYEVFYSETAGGHEPLNWRGGFAEGLIQLFL